jgi:mannitol-1-phosphate/altronate dehydrogenase
MRNAAGKRKVCLLLACSYMAPNGLHCKDSVRNYNKNEDRKWGLGHSLVNNIMITTRKLCSVK